MALRLRSRFAVGAQAAGIKDNEIVVGTHLDLSGPVAAGMPQLRNGMQMRLDEANEKGGIHGRKFKFVVEDNASQPQVAVRATEKLINSDEVFAIINPFGSGTNAAAVKARDRRRRDLLLALGRVCCAAEDFRQQPVAVHDHRQLRHYDGRRSQMDDR